MTPGIALTAFPSGVRIERITFLSLTPARPCLPARQALVAAGVPPPHLANVPQNVAVAAIRLCLGADIPKTPVDPETAHVRNDSPLCKRLPEAVCEQSIMLGLRI